MDGNAYKYEARVKEGDRCGALLRQPDGSRIPCPRPKMKGGIRCRYHGGPIAHPPTRITDLRPSETTMAETARIMERSALIGHVCQIIKKHVKDKDELTAIAAELTAIALNEGEMKVVKSSAVFTFEVNSVAWLHLREVVKVRKVLAAMDDFPQKRDVILLVDMCVYEMLEIMDK